MKRIAIIGATGYTGRELIRLLVGHPKVALTALTSTQSAGKAFSEIYPAFLGRVDLRLEPLKIAAIARRVDLAFLCLPHGESIETAATFLKKAVRVVDLSADFRLRSAASYEAWYGAPHAAPKLLQDALYGLPELSAKSYAGVRLIANPGCYPTATLLALAPLVAEGAVDLGSLICDAKSGTSGAGRSAKTDMLFCEVNENFYPYKIASHRHTPEIEQGLTALAGKPVHIQFTPHLLPVERGILATIYAKPYREWTEKKLRDLYRKFYKGKPFVRILKDGVFPSLAAVTRTNYCDIGLTYDPRTQNIVAVSAIDNLVKGASGQAIQNMNRLFGWKEGLGLL